jgi:hypothetical protein
MMACGRHHIRRCQMSLAPRSLTAPLSTSRSHCGREFAGCHLIYGRWMFRIVHGGGRLRPTGTDGGRGHGENAHDNQDKHKDFVGRHTSSVTPVIRLPIYDWRLNSRGGGPRSNNDDADSVGGSAAVPALTTLQRRAGAAAPAVSIAGSKPRANGVLADCRICATVCAPQRPAPTGSSRFAAAVTASPDSGPREVPTVARSEKGLQTSANTRIGTSLAERARCGS